MTEPALGITEVAARLGVTPFTVRSEVKKGRLKAFRVGRLLKVAPEVLDEYMHGTGVAVVVEEMAEEVHGTYEGSTLDD